MINSRFARPCAIHLAFVGMCAVSLSALAAADRDEAAITLKGSTTMLEVDSGRPVGKAVQALVEKYGYRVSYEDPRYAFSDDLEDVTARVRPDMDKVDPSVVPRIIVPKGGKLAVDLTSAKTPATAARKVVLAASTTSPGAQFQVVTAGAMVHVVPSGARDRNGNFTVQASALDALISLPVQERGAYATIQAICSAVSGAANVRVMVGTTGLEPSGDPSTEPLYKLGADNESARSVLTRAIDEIAKDRGELTWLLFYGNQVTENRYALNLLPVRMAVAKAVTPRVVAPKTTQQQDASAVPAQQ